MITGRPALAERVFEVSSLTLKGLKYDQQKCYSVMFSSESYFLSGAAGKPLENELLAPPAVAALN